MNLNLAKAVVIAGIIAASVIAAFIAVGDSDAGFSSIQPAAERRVTRADSAEFVASEKSAEKHHANHATNPRREKPKTTVGDEDQRAHGFAENFVPHSDKTKDAECSGCGATRLMLSSSATQSCSVCWRSFDRGNTSSPAYLFAAGQSAKSAGKNYVQKPATQRAHEPIADARKKPKNGTPENSKDAPAKPQKNDEASSSKSPERVASTRPPSGDNFSTVNPSPPTKKREWPKPFTPEEERIRQQMGVQAFINYQHELATGQSREQFD